MKESDKNKGEEDVKKRKSEINTRDQTISKKNRN